MNLTRQLADTRCFFDRFRPHSRPIRNKKTLDCETTNNKLSDSSSTLEAVRMSAGDAHELSTKLQFFQNSAR